LRLAGANAAADPMKRRAIFAENFMIDSILVVCVEWLFEGGQLFF
jgi:hypothetical protein